MGKNWSKGKKEELVFPFHEREREDGEVQPEDVKKFISKFVCSYDEDRYSFSVFHEVKVEELANYGVIPLNILDSIFTFLELPDLTNVFRTCKLFHIVSNSGRFWKDYYVNYERLIQEEKRFSVQEIESLREEENCKKRLFFLVTRKGEQYYKNKYHFGGGEGPVLFSAKVFVAGFEKTGKTSIVLQFIRGQFFENYESTIGAAFLTKRMDIKGTRGRLEVWDLAGQERFQSLCPKEVMLTSKKSFETVIKKLKDLEKNYQDMIDDGFIGVLAGNKVDLVESAPKLREIDDNEAMKLEVKISVVCSAKTGRNMITIFGICMDHLLEKEYEKRKKEEKK